MAAFFSWNKTFWGCGCFENGDNYHKIPLEPLLFGRMNGSEKPKSLNLI